MAPRTEHILSLCTGIAGLDLGVHDALRDLGRTPKCILYVEREALAAQVLAKRMAEGNLDAAPVWSDLRTLDATAWRGLVDGIVAGVPCQPHSTAGDRSGISDERWLWPDVERIIRDCDASWFFLENVDGLRTSNGGEALGSILEGLARLRFGPPRWVVLPASKVGATHQRKRLFLFAQRGELEHSKGVGVVPVAGTLPASLAGIAGSGEGDVANGSSVSGERRRRPILLGGAQAAESGEGRERQRHGDSLDDCRRDVADTYEAGLREGLPATDLNGPESRLGVDPGGGRLAVPAEGFTDGGAWPREFPPGPTDYAAWLNVLPERPDLVPATPKALSEVHGVADGIPPRLVGLRGRRRSERLKALGNAVVRKQGRIAFRLLVEEAGGLTT